MSRPAEARGDAQGDAQGDARGHDEDGGTGGRGERKKTPWLELAIGGAGALVLAAMVSYLLTDAFGGGDGPAEIVLEPHESVRRADGWHVPVRVRNVGDRPAEAVELRAELVSPGGETEGARLTVAFLPPHGSVEAVFLFERDPGGGTLELGVGGYLRP